MACFISDVRTCGEGEVGRGKHRKIESTDNSGLLFPYHGALGLTRRRLVNRVPDDLSVDPFLQKVLRWAQRQDRLGAVILTGSRAREWATVDAASDYDLEVFVAEPERYGSSLAWLEEISPVWVQLPPSEVGGEEDGGRRVWRLVFFEGGTKADFQIRPSEALAGIAEDGLDDLYKRGYVVLADPSGLASRLPAPSGRSPRLRPPTGADLLDVCSEFWFEAAHIPPYLARGELWVVKFRDGTMKRMLLRLIEWDALARLGPEADVWHIGTHMRDWAARDVWADLHRCYGRFDAEDAFAAFQATLELFCRLSRRVATGFGIRHPAHIEDAIRPHVAVLPDLSQARLEPLSSGVCERHDGAPFRASASGAFGTMMVGRLAGLPPSE